MKHCLGQGSLLGFVSVAVACSLMAATFGLLNAFGIELHQVSIAALIVVLGMVVDDAIVIADNYIELLDHGLVREEAAWRSARRRRVRAPSRVSPHATPAAAPARKSHAPDGNRLPMIVPGRSAIGR